MTTKCTSNPRLGLIGCGAEYGGERQHSVARVAWSEHDDGRAHITGALSTIDALWRGEKMLHPAERGFVELRPGYWGNENPRWATDSESPDSSHCDAESDETPPEGIPVPPKPEIGPPAPSQGLSGVNTNEETT